MHDPLIPLGTEPTEPPPSRGFGWITFVQIVLLLVVGGIAGYAAVQALKEPAAPTPPGLRSDRTASGARGPVPSGRGVCPGPIGRSSRRST